MTSGRYNYSKGESYRNTYKPSGIVKVLYLCFTCKREWYGATGFGFLSCPFCGGYLNIATRIDVSGGSMGLREFDGERYSTKPVQEE